MANIDVGNLGTTIMRSAGSDPGFRLYNSAGQELQADKPDAAAANPPDHYRLLPQPAPVAAPAPPAAAPGPPPPPPLSPTCAHNMIADTQTGGLKGDFAAGNSTVFLPFKANIIASAVLDGAAGARYFFTAELSGCSIFVDKDPATGRVIVYHANGRDRCANAQQIQDNWQVEWVPTPHTNYMDPLYNLAHASYQATYRALTLQGTLTKAQYGKVVRQEIARKAGQGRSRPNMLWGTNVFGVRNGAVWSFYYQTFGGLEEYDRPVYSSKRWQKTYEAYDKSLGFKQAAKAALKAGKEVRNRGFGPGAGPSAAVQILDHQLFCQC